MDFLSTETGQLASMAKQYLEGALTLDAAQREKGRILCLSTLALAGHGLELMLKACICLNGQTYPKSGRSGHEIEKLWAKEICEPIRGHVFLDATIVAEIDRTSGSYPDTVDEDDVLTLIEEYVIELGKLHGGIGFPLRYPSGPDKLAPNTPFLVKTLCRTADDLVKRPTEFELLRFRSRDHAPPP